MTLVALLAWPVAALAIVWSVLAAALGIAYVWRNPMRAGQRLDAAERRLAEHSSVLEALGRVDTSELDRVRLVLRRSGGS